MVALQGQRCDKGRWRLLQQSQISDAVHNRTACGTIWMRFCSQHVAVLVTAELSSWTSQGDLSGCMGHRSN